MVRLMRESFEPHRAAWHALAIILGASALIVPPEGLAALVDTWVLWLWAGLLVFSGLAGIVAPFGQISDALGALAVERSALWIQNGTLLWIIIAAIYYRGGKDALGVVAYAIWIIANVIRERRIASAVTNSGDQPAGE